MAPLPNDGAKTILLVVSNPIFRKVFQLILEGGHFAVLTATSAKESMIMEVGFHRPIHLLISEVMMPDMTGPDLAQAMKERRPEMRVMLFSHYPDGGLLLLNYGWQFIKKAFLAKVLLERVNEIIGEEPEDQAMDRFDTRK